MKSLEISVKTVIRMGGGRPLMDTGAVLEQLFALTVRVNLYFLAILFVFILFLLILCSVCQCLRYQFEIAQ